MENFQPDLNSLKIKLGSTVSEKLKLVSQIKDAMTYAIMVMVEQETISKDDPHFAVFQTFYLEANHLEAALKLI